jgi:hypothetical protein
MKSKQTQAASRCTEQQIVGFINDGKHLPKWMQDFHDQKDVFKAIEQTLGRIEPPYDVNWANAQCYVIDRFLRFMALHGYTLRKTKRFGSLDVEKTVGQCKLARGAAFFKSLEANTRMSKS